MAGFSLAARLEAGHHGSVGRSLRVLVVDDHAPFRRTARQILEQAGFEVVGEATDGAQALDLALALRPDGVLLDVQLPDTDGFQVAAELRRRPDPPVVVLVSSRSRSDYGPLIERSGAAGFLAKGELDGTALRALVSPSRAEPGQSRP